MFVPGREYRREDIHRLVGGQRQSGIVTPRGSRVVLLFSSPRGATMATGMGGAKTAGSIGTAVRGSTAT
jgi:hypothetical protein